MENKWTFLERGKELGVPISPYLNMPSLVIKHRNEEGGMGIHFFSNATAGGDWIIQERIDNSDFVNSLLPKNAPLSTFRIITMSKASIDLKSLGDSSSEDISALSCVFRAGRENALTDHSSILFDVDLNTGKIKKGSSNDNWYRIGLGNILTCPWRTNDEDQRVNSHPDVAEGGVIEGKKILQIEEMKDLVER